MQVKSSLFGGKPIHFVDNILAIIRLKCQVYIEKSKCKTHFL